MKFEIFKILFKNVCDLFSSKKSLSSATGGSATALGNYCTAIGGNGGISIMVGVGGSGGNAAALGENLFVSGGDGGNAGQADGRGGRRTQSQGEKLNLPTHVWGYGYGGAGANRPEYNRRLNLLITIRNEYIKTFPCDEIFIVSGIDPVPENWINKRLEELSESRRVTLIGGLIIMPPL